MNSTPIYKTRKFWVTLLSIQFVAILIFCYVFMFPFSRESEILNFLSIIYVAMGGGVYYLILGEIIGITNTLINFILAITVSFLLLYKAFKAKAVNVIYPIILSITSLASITLAILLAGAL